MDNAQDFIATHGSNAAIVVNFSGGKDSMRLLGYICEHFPNVKKYVVYADTGFEHVKPISAEDWSRKAVAIYGLNLNVVRNPNKTYLEMVKARKMFPGPSTRQCTSDLKRGPIEKFIRSLPEKFIINATGIRAAESPARSKQNPWKMNGGWNEETNSYTGLSRAGRVVYNWMPIFGETLKQVLFWHWDNGIPLHPVYIPEYHGDGRTGGYLRRYSCRVCIFSTDNDIRAIHANDPEAFYLVSDLEERSGFTMKNGKSLLQILAAPARDGKQYGSEEEVGSPCAA